LKRIAANAFVQINVQTQTNIVDVIVMTDESHGTSKREAGRNNLVKRNKIPSDKRSAREKNERTRLLRSWIERLRRCFSQPLIIFGRAKTFVIREKSPPSQHIALDADGSEATCHVLFREWFTSRPRPTRTNSCKKRVLY